MIKFIYILLSAFIFLGCECVPELDTNKITEPVNNAGLVIFNGISDLQSINIYSNDLKLYSDLKKYQNTEKHIKFPVKNAGYLSIWNEDNTYRLINLPLELEQGKYYTLILSGTSSEPEFILLEDFADADANKKYFRVINISNIYITVKSVREANNLMFILNSQQYSQNEEIESTSCKLEFIHDDTLIDEYEAEISDGVLISCIFINNKIEPRLKVFTIQYPN